MLNGASTMCSAKRLAVLLCTLLTLGIAGNAAAQVANAQGAKRGSDPEHKLNLTWDRWLDHTEVGDLMKLMEKTWPRFLKLQSLGKSYGKRDIWRMTVNNPATGAEMNKSAMFIEANVHGNEIQGTEVSLYTLWYLMENYDRIPTVKRLVDERVFYVLPTINPDGRDFFLYGTGDGSRTGHVPVDSDGDGKFDEDGPDDLNGNGLIDEDPPGGYDGNRNYGSDWQPNYVQGGSMDYPFQLPEARATNDFWMTHPNIAGFQTYHNSGGMILRPPGSAWYGDYPAADIRAYDEIAEMGERMLPYYDYLVVWRGLYTVHGGSMDWTNDGLGILSYSNELWNGGQYYNSPLLQKQTADPASPIAGQKGGLFFDDFLEFGDEYEEWKPFDHPQYGKVELGGWKKLQGRVNPRFMSIELFHRNMAFTLHHADQMPLVSMENATVEKVEGDVYRVRVDVSNSRVIPTIMVKAAATRVVRPDVLTLEGRNASVITAGVVLNKFQPGPLSMIDQKDLKRVIIRNGLPGKTTRTIEYLVKGSGPVTIQYSALKGGTVRTTVDLR